MDTRLERLIERAESDAVLADIGEAKTLPSNAYTAESWLELERERIFERHWTALLFESVLPAPGDVQPLDLLGVPLLVVRGDDNRLRVFHNICPYDGCPVVRSPVRGLEEMVVLYHGWRYDLRGKLVGAPYWNGLESCDASGVGDQPVDLAEVPSAVRLGVLFVNLDGKARDIDQWLAPWKRLVSRDYAVDRLVPAVDESGKPLVEERTVAANWKTYQENASINILHEAFTHAMYRKSPEVPRVDTHGNRRYQTHIEDCLVAFSHSRRDSGQTYDRYRLPSAGHDPEREPDNGYFTTLYPNVNVPALDVMLKINIAIPISPGETRLQHLRFYSPEALEAAGFRGEESAVQKLFDEVHFEDQLAIEAVQSARRSPVFRQHYYAPQWDALHHRFNQLVMQDLLIA